MLSKESARVCNKLREEDAYRNAYKGSYNIWYQVLERRRDLDLHQIRSDIQTHADGRRYKTDAYDNSYENAQNNGIYADGHCDRENDGHEHTGDACCVGDRGAGDAREDHGGKDIAAVLEKCNCAVAVEDHNYFCGLSSAICEIACHFHPCKVRRLGLRDVYPRSGKAAELLDAYGLSVKDIIDAAKDAMK